MLRLFTTPDGSVGRNDRAMWLTMPFNIAFEIPLQPVTPAGGPFVFSFDPNEWVALGIS